jgi:hypothetical protein
VTSATNAASNGQPPPPLAINAVVSALQARGLLGSSASKFGETAITNVLRESLVALRLAGYQAAQRELVDGLLGDPNAGGVPTGHPARALLQQDVFCPQLSGRDAPDLVLMVPTAKDSKAPYITALVIEHKPHKTPAQFSRARVLWPNGAQVKGSRWGPGTLFDPDPVAQQYRDAEFVRDWTFNLPYPANIDERCLDPHGLSPTNLDRCEFNVLARFPGVRGKDEWRHDKRSGVNKLRIGIPQIDAYRCSRGWVDSHARAAPHIGFTLDVPSDVAWVVLSGNKPGTSVDEIWKGWAATADLWAISEYAWLRDHVDRAYNKAWAAAGQPQTLPAGVSWLQLLASMLHLAPH